jgi:anthranilate synthase component 1
MEIIDEMEKEPTRRLRRIVGYVSFSGNMDFAITIRTASIEGDRLNREGWSRNCLQTLFPETERVETVNKAMSYRKHLKLVAKNVKKGNSHDPHDR